MSYVDGFVVPVPKKNLDAYRKLARKAGKVWKEHGALAYVECVGDDVPPGKVTSFDKSVKRPGRWWRSRGLSTRVERSATASTRRAFRAH